jgi:hypothetical protein
MGNMYQSNKIAPNQLGYLDLRCSQWFELMTFPFGEDSTRHLPRGIRVFWLTNVRNIGIACVHSVTFP